MKASNVLRRRALAYDAYQRATNTAASAVGSVAAHEIPHENKSLIFLHGILGSKRNWRTPANVFRKLHPEFKCFAVDFRGHGDSHTSHDLEEWEDNTVHSSAQDLYNLIHDSPLGLVRAPTILLAHSFGGKVALRYLEKLHLAGHELPDHTWILDSIPGPYRKSDIDSCPNSELQSVYNILEILKSFPAEFESRDWVVKELCVRGVDLAVAQWIATSVIPIKGKKFGWGFNLSVIQELFHDFCDTDMWHFLENYNGNGKIHFIRAGKNPSWTDKVLNRFTVLEPNPNILLHEMSDVGHWIHAEDLHGMFRIISRESGLNSE